jgi:hypothetical protein
MEFAAQGTAHPVKAVYFTNGVSYKRYVEVCPQMKALNLTA